jgi:hypothetical protein
VIGEKGRKLADVGAGGEGAPRASDDEDPNPGVGRDSLHDPRQAAPNGGVEGVAGCGSVQEQSGHRPIEREFERAFG